MSDVWLALIAILVPLITAITALVVAIKANNKGIRNNKTLLDQNLRDLKDKTKE
ncbi:unnamed protein product [marine sediment metagenome]|uniref:Uncharacterized protein n=1 Tax=marine sediment metagenome TaxID=412755 RepID=X1SI37_9ZZZZ